MLNTRLKLDVPTNEPVRSYAPGSSEAESLKKKLAELSNSGLEIPCIVGGEEVFTGDTVDNTAPHDHENLVCRWHRATPDVVDRAIAASESAWREWSNTPIQTRTAIFEKAAELLAGSWRDTVNAATMLGQSKTCFQAEIDSACELADFWRFNNYFAVEQVYAEQPPISPRGMRNSSDHRSLDGFVYAITPFNFTSIAGNLPGSPALMGNCVIWKPSSHSLLSNYYIMKLYEAAGMPPGVINFVPGNPVAITDRVLESPSYAGLHYTGSTEVFQGLWQRMAERLPNYRNYPRIVGETGGKDFIFVHPSADTRATAIAALRGAYEYQGQKCSAASRMFVPRSLWADVRDQLIAEIKTIRVGDPADFSNFMCAVIHERSFDKCSRYIGMAREQSGAEVLQGGQTNREQGWFVEPTLIECQDPKFPSMVDEIFGPILSVHVYDDDRIEDALELCDTSSPYALTGAIFAQDRVAAEELTQTLRHAAGNFYINDKPTGAVVGQQPFGGARASGTNDKAGSAMNLWRWVSSRSIKETFDPPRDYGYPHMG